MLTRRRFLIFRHFGREAGAAAQPKRSEGARPRDHRKNLFRVFQRETNGLAALEFALIAPVLIAMLFGMGELSSAIIARTDISQITSTVSDLVAQESTVASTDLSNVYNAANTILYPFYKGDAGTTPSIRITSVIFDTTTNSTTAGKVAWSCAQTGNLAFQSGGATQRAKNSTYTFDQPLLSSGSSVLLVEVAYGYSSPTTIAVTTPFKYYDSFVTKPRRVAQIPAPSPVPAGCSA
jgi:Flp pilus assembly protein TadG